MNFDVSLHAELEWETHLTEGALERLLLVRPLVDN